MVNTYIPYANALYELGQETNKTAVFMEELKQLSDTWQAEKEFILALNHPKITTVEKKEWLTSLFKDKIDPVLFQFLLVLTEHGVIANLNDVYKAFVACYREDQQIEEVTIETASALDESQIKALKEMLEKKLNKKIELVIKEDASLIAGLRVRAQDIVLDNTLVSKLDRMKEQLSEK